MDTTTAMECKSCHTISQFIVNVANYGGLGYTTMTCPECQYRIASCDDCSKTYSITGRKFTNINAHVKTHVDSRRVPDLQLRTRDEPLVDDDMNITIVMITLSHIMMTIMTTSHMSQPKLPKF